jgi:hypothetical protein
MEKTNQYDLVLKEMGSVWILMRKTINGAGIFINPNRNMIITCTIELVPVSWQGTGSGRRDI